MPQRPLRLAPDFPRLVVQACGRDPPPPLRGGGSGPKMLHRETGELSAKLTEGAFGAVRAPAPPRLRRLFAGSLRSWSAALDSLCRHLNAVPRPMATLRPRPIYGAITS
jgi:hypothetical protein